MNINLTMVNCCIVYGCKNELKPNVALHEVTSLKTDKDRLRCFVEHSVIEMSQQNIK